MEGFEVIITVAIIATAALVGLAVWFANQRAIKQMEIQNLNYRTELRTSASSTITGGNTEESDPLQSLMDFAMKNPEMLQKILGGLNQQRPPLGGIT